MLALVIAPVAGWCAEKAAETAPVEAAKKDHSVSPKPREITRIGSLPITNSMAVSWIVALGLILFAQVRHAQHPAGAEWSARISGSGWWKACTISLEGIIGPQLVKRTFWFFATIFIFILFANWCGLIPGIGTIGYGHQTPEGFEIDRALFRGVNADLNMTFAMSLIFFACWTFWAIQSNGPIGFLKHLFAPKGNTTGALRVLLVVVFFAVGFLEIFSILFRPISLSFRLYGNIFAGENMLEAMSHLVPHLEWLIPVPFYFMELLVGVIQALVFMLLTAVFTMLIMPHDDHDHGHEEAHH